jgi:glutamate racemase
MEDFILKRAPLVCMFDSGIGGLNLLDVCVRKLPDVNFVYLADNYHVPYGNLPKEQVFDLVDEKFQVMQSLGCDVAVIACNTVTALCIEQLRKKYPFPIVGMQPAIKEAAAHYRNILVLATCATAESPSFAALMQKYAEGRGRVVACHTLARDIEQNIDDLSRVSLSLHLPDCHPDAVVLGCTHYAFLKESIKNYYDCAVFDGMLGTADHLCTLLGTVDHIGGKNGKVDFMFGNFGKNNEIFRGLRVRGSQEKM